MKPRVFLPLTFFALILGITPAFSESVTPLSQLTQVSNCKLSKFDTPNNDVVGTGYLGFPTPKERLNTSKTINAAIIGVDFPDLQSKTSSPKSDYTYITKPITKWYSDLSHGKMIFNWRINTKYVRMPQKLSNYNIGGSSAGTGRNTVRADQFIQNAISLAEKSFDFKNVDLVVIAPPLNTTGDQVTNGGAYPTPTGSGFKYSGGEILNATIINVQEISSRIYAPWYGALPLAHEIGHLTGLTDLYDTGWINKGNNTSDQFKFMGIFSYMNYAGPTGNAILPTIWEQWQVGWADDSQIRCVKNLVNSTHLISSLGGSSKGIKGVVIPISETKAIVVESRRKIGFDSGMPSSAEGALVYSIDITTFSGNGPMKIARKSSSKKSLFEDAPLKSSEYVDFLGYRIQNLSMNKDSDLVSVRKIDGKISSIPNPSTQAKISQNQGGQKANNSTELSVQSLGGVGTSQTEGYVEYVASGMQSYKIQIVILGTDTEVWNSGIINFNQKSSRIPVSNLSCPNRYRIKMTIYSKINGQGDSRTTQNDGMLSPINCG